jgi:phosphoribosylamine--glycine ligase
MLGPEAVFGEAGREVVIEEFMDGEEASVFAVCDGTRYVLLPTAQDHKRALDGDAGPNTGGMGAYSPAPVMTRELLEQTCREVIEPTLKGMRSEGCPYVGVLYVGLMLTSKGPKVVEFNCRLGDPETQPILFRLRGDLLDLCLQTFDGTLGERPIDWDPRAAVGVVMASGGYPDAYEKGKPISGLDDVFGADVKVFHAGTRLEGGRVLSDGGRVLCVVGTGATVRAACNAAYAGVRKISWDGGFYRTDIGHRAIQREESR